MKTSIKTNSSRAQNQNQDFEKGIIDPLKKNENIIKQQTHVVVQSLIRKSTYIQYTCTVANLVDSIGRMITP